MTKTKADAIVEIIRADRKDRVSKTTYRKLIAALRLLDFQYSEMLPILKFMDYHNEDGSPRSGLVQSE